MFFSNFSSIFLGSHGWTTETKWFFHLYNIASTNLCIWAWISLSINTLNMPFKLWFFRSLLPVSNSIQWETILKEPINRQWTAFVYWSRPHFYFMQALLCTPVNKYFMYRLLSSTSYKKLKNSSLWKNCLLKVPV